MQRRALSSSVGPNWSKLAQRRATRRRSAAGRQQSLSHFGWFFFGAEAVPAHLTLAVAGHAVRVQRQKSAGEMSSGAAQFAQGDLQLLGLLDGVTLPEAVDGQVGGGLNKLGRVGGIK